jgi:hypothetical protein
MFAGVVQSGLTSCVPRFQTMNWAFSEELADENEVGAGYDDIDTEAARKYGIKVSRFHACHLLTRHFAPSSQH